MNNPLVSIILPTYNGARYIRESIESCLNQTYRNLELIIVNDFSIDNTSFIISEYALKDKRVKVIHNQYNQKLPLSLNTGFKDAQGKYFTWTSDDNYYSTGSIEKLVTVMESTSTIDIVYTDYKQINDKNDVVGTMQFGDINKSFFKWKGCGACFLYKAEVHYKNQGYDPSAFLIEDYDFFVRAYVNKFRFHYIQNSDLYYYRIHDASLTGTSAHAVYDMQKIIVERHLSNIVNIVNTRDKILLYRKYAVYFGSVKSHPIKMSYYFSLLASESKTQLVLAAAYIIYQKINQFFKMTFYTILFFIKNIFNKKENT